MKIIKSITEEKISKNKQVPDASLKFQKLLPISSDAFIKKLDDWGIKYKFFEHIPLRTVEASKSIQDIFLNASEGGAHIKNLFLRDHKKTILKTLKNNINLRSLKVLEIGSFISDLLYFLKKE